MQAPPWSHDQDDDTSHMNNDDGSHINNEPARLPAGLGNEGRRATWGKSGNATQHLEPRRKQA
jgi:hypothetical protein